MLRTTVVLSPDAASAAEARRVVRTCLDGWGADDVSCDAAVLLASELVTNAVLHARTPLSLELDRRGAGIHVGVRDRHPALPKARRYNLDSATGRGLRLLETLASAWGVERVVDPAGKVVWFELPLHTEDVDEDELNAAFAHVLAVEWLPAAADR